MSYLSPTAGMTEANLEIHYDKVLFFRTKQQDAYRGWVSD